MEREKAKHSHDGILYKLGRWLSDNWLSDYDNSRKKNNSTSRDSMLRIYIRIMVNSVETN